MASGDYLVHVFIEGVKNLEVEEMSQGDSVNALFQVESCGIKQYTSVKQAEVGVDDQVATWNEHLYFEVKDVKREFIEAQ